MRIQFFLLVFPINASIAIAAELQEAAGFPDKQITGIGVPTKSGRIFVNFPSWSDDHYATASQIENMPRFNNDKPARTEPYKLWKITGIKRE